MDVSKMTDVTEMTAGVRREVEDIKFERQRLAKWERELYERVLKHVDYSPAAAAKMLGTSRHVVRRRSLTFGIRRPARHVVLSK